MINYIENIIHSNVCSESRFSNPQPRFVRDQGSRTDGGFVSAMIEAVRLLYARGQVRGTDGKVGSKVQLTLGNMLI